jgi:hypothetical protein
MSGAEFVFSAIGVVSALVAGAWALIKIAVTQFQRNLDVRFSQLEAARVEGRRALDERFTSMDESQRRFERELLELKAELPRQYVLRDDQIRRDTIIDAKLDALNARLELLLERRQLIGAVDGR